MRIGVIIIIISYTDPEVVQNALRFANTAILEGHYVKIFLLAAGVEIESIKGEKLNVQEQLQKINEQSGTVVAAPAAAVVGSDPIRFTFTNLVNYDINLRLFSVIVGRNISQCQFRILPFVRYTPP